METRKAEQARRRTAIYRMFQKHGAERAAQAFGISPGRVRDIVQYGPWNSQKKRPRRQ